MNTTTEERTRSKKSKTKLKKRSELCSKEKKDGTTYKTAVASTESEENSTGAEVPLDEFIKIPEVEQVTKTDNLVYCDIETGSLSMDCDILQISACTNGKIFNQYILPSKPISWSASNVTGLTAQGGVLFLHGSPVSAVPLKDGLLNFLTWLKNLGPVTLIGHNFKVFDFPRLIRAILAAGLKENFEEVCLGAIDTLPIFKNQYPEAEKYKQEHLYEMVINSKYQAHNAVDDVISLEKLLSQNMPSTETLLKFSFSTSWGFENQAFKEVVENRLQTFQTLLDNKVVSKQILTKLASAGLCYTHLHDAFSRDGETGLQTLLKERVKLSNKSLQCITGFFSVLG